MLQKDHLFEWLTIYENVLLGLEIQKEKQKNLFHTLTVSYRSMVSGTSQFSHPSQLSGGMRQRAALIRTLALNLHFCFSMNLSAHWIIRPDFPSVMTSGRSCVKKGKPRFWSLTISPKPSACLIGSSSSRSPCLRPVRVPILTTLADRTPMQMRNAPNSSNIFNRSGRS